MVSARTEAPGKAAGFEFGQSAERAAEVCSAAGGRWEAGASEAKCSQPPLAVGIDGEVALTLCNGRVCTVRIVRDTPDTQAEDLKARFLRIASALQGKYGKPDQASIRVPAMCSDRLASCLRARQAKLLATWNWPSQHAVSISLNPKSEGVSLALEYRSPKEVAGSLDGL